MTSNSSAKYVRALDGVRGIAILSVLLFHNFLIPGGWIGVDLFFALSGFLITRILTESKGSVGYYRRFYYRRFLRIVPAYWMLLISVAVVDAAARSRFVWYFSYLGDFNFLFPKMDTAAYHHTWSLAVEGQFYLVWPIVVAYVRPITLRRICIAAIFGMMVLRLISMKLSFPISFINYNILTRSDALLLGAALGSLAASVEPSLFKKTKHVAAIAGGVSAMGLVALTIAGLASVSYSPSAIMVTIGMGCVAVLSASLVWLVFIDVFPCLTSLMSFSPLCHLGTISYGVYLYHQPILIYLGPFIRSFVTDNRLGFGLSVTALSLAAAEFSWRLMEKPLLQLKKKKRSWTSSLKHE